MKTVIIELAERQQKLNTLHAFAEKYGHRFPEEILAHALFDGQHPKIAFWFRNSFTDNREVIQSNRDRVLSKVGEVFGTEGWAEYLNHERSAYDWKRVVDGVQVVLYSAAELHAPADGTPVFPGRFPIMLEDARPAAAAQ